MNDEVIIVYRVDLEEEVPVVPLIGEDGKLVDRVKEIFNEWFDMYSNEKGEMTKETCGLFIKGCTGETPGLNDDRINSLFKTYD